MVAPELLGHLTQEDVFHQELACLVRTGPPDARDLLGAVIFAFTAAHLAERGIFGRMAAFHQNAMWTHVDLNQAVQEIKTVDVDAWYDTTYYKPKLDLIWSVENL